MSQRADCVEIMHRVVTELNHWSPTLHHVYPGVL